jgi:exodeoxyribonuclease V gamma subunit
MVGLSDELFPRRATRAPFDLMAGQPRSADRSLRDDDKQLFLEALLSARDAVIMTYVGRSAKDDGVRPPSVLLDQLLRVVSRHFVVVGRDRSLSLFAREEGDAAHAITHEHALLRFDPRYFRAPKHPVFFSYDEAACALARAHGGRTRRERPFVTEPLPKGEPQREVSVDELARFFRNPAQAFCERRLGVSLPRELDPVRDREPIVLDGLEAWRVGDELLTRGDEPVSEGLITSMQQRALIPPGVRGERTLRKIEKLAARIVAHSQTERPPKRLTVDFELSGVRIHGSVGMVSETTRVERIYAQPRAKHLLGAWVRHLAWCSAQPGLAASAESVLSGRTAQGVVLSRLRALTDASAVLSELLELFHLGHASPLPLLGDTSRAYAEARLSGQPHERALATAQAKALQTGVDRATELTDPYLRMVFTDASLADLETLAPPNASDTLSFAALSLRVWEPLLAGLDEEKLS